MTAAALESRDGIRWRAHALVEKYSPDQTAWAERRFAEEQSWRGAGSTLAAARSVLRRLRFGPLALQGDDFRRYFPSGPEDGIAEAAGNLLVTAGLTAITALLTGAGGGNGTYNIGHADAVLGVGSTSTAAAVGDTHLGADGTAANGSVGAWYQQMDSSFPTVSAGVMTGQSTFAANANSAFAWQEWCWVSGTGAITAGTTISAIYATGASFAMWNHKVTSLGTKTSSASWVFSNTITLS